MRFRTIGPRAPFICSIYRLEPTENEPEMTWARIIDFNLSFRSITHEAFNRTGTTAIVSICRNMRAVFLNKYRIKIYY